MSPFPFDPPTGWVPSSYVDETSPPYRDTPDEWIVAHAASSQGVYLAGPNEDQDGSDITGRIFVPAFNVATFSAYFAMGHIEIAVLPDGSWTCATPVPAGASNFTIPGDHDFHALDIDTIAHNWAALEGGTGDETLTIECWHWIDGLPFVLGRLAGEPFSFVPIQSVGDRISERAVG